jgi:hypothetical protein
MRRRIWASASPHWDRLRVSLSSTQEAPTERPRSRVSPGRRSFRSITTAKKRQWALDQLDIKTEWVLLIDADEVVPNMLWDEISAAISDSSSPPAFLITKGFHFLGRRFRFGGFSFGAVLLFRTGKARFERLVDDDASGLDMEVHERLSMDRLGDSARR